MAKVIVFIHGIGSNNTTWNNFIETIKSDSATKNCEEYILNATNVEKDKTYYYLYEYSSTILETKGILKLFNKKSTGKQSSGDITIQKHSKTFEGVLEILADEFENINIIAHSMGGIILMNMLFDILNNNLNLKNKIDKCILYGSPLNGSNEPNELKKILKLDVSTNILNELKPNSNTISKLKQNIEKNSKNLQNNFQIMFIAGDSDSRIIDVNETTIQKFGRFIQISGGHSEIIQPNISSPSFIHFKKFLFNKNPLSEFSRAEDFKLNSNYLKKINDIGLKLSHPNKNNIYLSDIFTFPDLQDLEDKNKNKINSKQLLNIKKYKKSIIFGDEVSGKTSLALTYQKLLEKDYIPIYFDAKNLKKPDIKTFENRMYLNIRRQYFELERDTIELFRKRYKERIIIIIDNLENLAIKKNDAKAIFLNMLNKHFEHIVLFSNDSFEIEVMSKETLKEEIFDYKILKIKEFGFKLRDKIIDNWINIGDHYYNDNELFEKKDKLSKTIETLIGNKFIPTYPLYLTLLLQQIEAGTSNNLSGSAYAEFYNY